MALSEFELISRYFDQSAAARDDVVLGIGDDAALVRVPPGCELALAIDTMVAGVHFPHDAAPAGLGHKILAVNLSDLAAMGAEPAWATLALTLPRADEAWLAEFARGFFALAARYRVQLIGGDTTRGPLTLTVQAHGFVPAGQGLRRAGARPGDFVYVTGTPGDAALGLAVWQGRCALPEEYRDHVFARLHRSQPRVEMGLALRGLASAAIDVSDGLAADLGHILVASGVGAALELERLPLSPAMRAARATEGLPWRDWVLSGGDDYELCFTVPPAHGAEVERRGAALGVLCTRIGVIERDAGVRVRDVNGAVLDLARRGYEHFT